MVAAPSSSMSWSDATLRTLLLRLTEPARMHDFGPYNDKIRLQRSAIKGAYLETRRDLPQGCEVFRDRPLLVVMRQDLSTRCLRCAAELSSLPRSSTRTCSKCSHAWCCDDCFRLDASFHVVECAMLQRLPELHRICQKYRSVRKHDVTTMVRGLAIRVADPERWAALCCLEDNRRISEAQDTRFPQWRDAAADVHSSLSARLDAMDKASAEDALRILLIANINAVSGSTAGIGGAPNGNAPVSIYPIFCRLEHSCLPNAVFHNLPSGPLEIVVRTRQAVKAGDSLAISYVLLDEPTHRRQSDLQRDKYFRCVCDRCTGRNGAGEGNICSLRCKKSAGTSTCSGRVQPRGYDYDLVRMPWACDKCGSLLPFEDVEALETQMFTALEAADSPKACEQLLRNFGPRLPRDHYMRFLCEAQRAELLLRPVERQILSGRAKEVPKETVEEVCKLYEDVVLPWAKQRIPRRVLQMHSSWCTMFYRLGQARLALAVHVGNPALFRGALEAYQEALAETQLCMGQEFAAPLQGFVGQLQKSLASIER